MGGESDAGDSPLLDGVVFEEGTHEEGGASGLELDPQQAAEIRKIFLTTLPDYLTPIKEMVARLSSEADEDGQIRSALSKTIASIAEAASRVKLDDVAASMQALREDVILLGDPGEPQGPLMKRITTALVALSDLAESGGAAPADVHREAHAETILAVLGDAGVDGASLQKLVAAGVIYVDQLCDADPKEVVMVSGLDAQTVAKLVRLAREKRGKPSTASRPVAAVVASRPPVNDVQPAMAEAATPGDPRGRARQFVRALVDDELALDEARGEALRLRVGVKALRAEAAEIERQCETLRASTAEARDRAAARAAKLTKATARRSAIEREHAAVMTALEQTARRLTALRSERREALAELARLAEETASLTADVERVLESREAQERR